MGRPTNLCDSTFQPCTVSRRMIKMALAIRVGLLVCFITECNAMQVHMDHDPVFVLLSGSKLSEHKKAHMPESLPVTVPWEMSPSPTPSITIARVASPTTTSQQRAHGSDEQTNHRVRRALPIHRVRQARPIHRVRQTLPIH